MINNAVHSPVRFMYFVIGFLLTLISKRYINRRKLCAFDVGVGALDFDLSKGDLSECANLYRVEQTKWCLLNSGY